MAEGTARPTGAMIEFMAQHLQRIATVLGLCCMAFGQAGSLASPSAPRLGLHLGGGGQVSVPLAPRPPRSALTVACRFQLTGKAKGKPDLLSRWHPDSKIIDGAFRLQLLPSNKILVTLRNQEGTRLTLSSPKWKGASWRHVAASYDGSRLLIYLDGKLVAEREAPRFGELASTESPLRIGPPTAKSKRKQAILPGFIDDIQIWGSALSASELRLLVKNGARGDEEGLELALTLRSDRRSAEIQSLAGPRARLDDGLRRRGFCEAPSWKESAGDGAAPLLFAYDLGSESPQGQVTMPSTRRSILVDDPRSDRIGVIWQGKADAVYLTWVDADLGGHETLSLPSLAKGILMAGTSDDEGNVYYLLVQASKKAASDPLPTVLHKVNSDATPVTSAELDSSREGLNIFNPDGRWGGSMRWHKGTLALILPRRMHRSGDGLRHQGAIARHLQGQGSQPHSQSGPDQRALLRQRPRGQRSRRIHRARPGGTTSLAV